MRGLLVSLIIAAVAVGGFMIVQENGGANAIASAVSPASSGSHATYCGGVGRGGEYCGDK